MRFYDYFFSYKWDFFYGFILMFLQEIQDSLMQKDDPADIIQLLKDYTFEFRVNRCTEKGKRDDHLDLIRKFILVTS